MPRSPDGTSLPSPYVRDIAKTNDRDANEGTPMTAEINILIAAQDHRAELLAEADARRLTRTRDPHAAGTIRPARRRLTILLRRLAGAPASA